MEPQENRGRVLLKHDKSIAGLYDMEKSLGSGHFAVVKLARHVFSREYVAIKVIDKSKLDDVAKSHLYQEVRCMKLVQHPNVVRLYEVIDTQTKLYLILEYGDGGDMYDHIMKHDGGINEEKARHYFKQIVSAIDYCHKLHVVHRDLKPENVIFFKSQDLAKLTDFGFSNNFLPGEKLYTSCGSLAYSAPEILLGDSYDAAAVDVWSLGVILYMMVCGRGPFSHANDSETLTMIMDCKYDLPSTLSEPCKSLISRMLVRLPSKRATLESIVSDLWVNCGHLEKSSLSPAPLISEINISKEIHLSVLQQMEAGKIASKEEIEKSLQEDKYDHVTATYFLIAERMLKKRHGFAALHVKLEERRSYPYEFISSRPLTEVDSLEKNEIEASSKNVGVFDNDYHHHYPPTNDLTKEHSQSDECLTENSSTYCQDLPLKPLQRSHRLTHPLFGMTKSSPNILNEISEESEMEESPRGSPLLQRRSSQRRRPKYHSCRGLSPIHSRRSSCSSSDEDDMHHMFNETRYLNTTSHPASTVQTNQSNMDQSQGNQSRSSSDVDKKVLSLNELENEKNLMRLSLPTRKMLSNVNYRDGRHFSDTNLTWYSLQLQLALSRGNLKSTTHTYSKCSSDTNLVSTMNKKKNQFLFSADLLRHRDFLSKFLKRGRSNCAKTSSSLSLSLTIEEEPDGKQSMSIEESNMYVLSNGKAASVCDEPNSNSMDIFTPVKYHSGVFSKVTELNTQELCSLLPIRGISTSNPKSICCSLI